MRDLAMKLISIRAFWLIPILLMVSGLIISCSSGGGSGGSVKGLKVTTGQFIDSAVEGLQYTYISSGTSGLTGSGGNFMVQVGSLVEFHIGDIALGQSAATHLMSPVNFGTATNVTNDMTTNIARFLQIIDDDGDPSNGILITNNVRSLAAGMSVNFNRTPTSFENDGNVQTVVSTLTAATGAGARMLTSVDVAVAQDHLSSSLTATLNDNVDTFFATSFSDFKNCPSNARDSVANGSITINSVTGGSNIFSGSGSFSANVGGATIQHT